MSSLNPEDAISDYSALDEKDRKTLDQWYSFFEKVRAVPRFALAIKPAADFPVCLQRYNIIGKVKL